MVHVHRAAWVLPIVSPPIREGWVAVESGRVVAVGGPSDAVNLDWVDREPLARDPSSRSTSAILPGLTNAHMHLELSWMRGQIPPGDAMPAWASRLIGLRRSMGADPVEPIREAIEEAIAAGTALVGDVTNSLVAYEPLTRSPLSAAIFFELIGFRAGDPQGTVRAACDRLSSLERVDRLRPSVAPHAPYSVSPALFRAIGERVERGPLSVHLGESPEEIQFLKSGTGPWRALLETIGAWSTDWAAPGCGPVEYLSRLGLLDDRLLAVHATQLTEEELGRLATANATVVACPRSNRWTGAGVPPIARFYESGVRVALGTDSLASVADLNLFQEMAAVRETAPAVPAQKILRSATLDGARALGFDGELGAIAPGARAALISVEIPAGREDVEEYLVGGVHPAAVSWLNQDSRLGSSANERERVSLVSGAGHGGPASEPVGESEGRSPSDKTT